MKRTLPARYGEVRYGNGGGIALDEQARHYTVDCLQKLADLLHAQKTDPKDGGDDCRLQFAVAKYLLETAWGRNPLRAIERAADELMTPDEQAKLRRFIDEYARAQKTLGQSDATSIIDGTLSGGTGADGMGEHGAPRAADAKG